MYISDYANKRNPSVFDQHAVHYKRSRLSREERCINAKYVKVCAQRLTAASRRSIYSPIVVANRMIVKAKRGWKDRRRRNAIPGDRSAGHSRIFIRVFSAKYADDRGTSRDSSEFRARHSSVPINTVVNRRSAEACENVPLGVTTRSYSGYEKSRRKRDNAVVRLSANIELYK